MKESVLEKERSRIPAEKCRVTVQDALSRLPAPGGERFVSVLEHGSLEVEFYAPRGVDPQSPHTRDEVYVVVSGSGVFRNGRAQQRFAPGDLLFVPAGREHRFEFFTDDLAAWVIFYGPEGGEIGPAASEENKDAMAMRKAHTRLQTRLQARAQQISRAGVSPV